MHEQIRENLIVPAQIGEWRAGSVNGEGQRRSQACVANLSRNLVTNRLRIFETFHPQPAVPMQEITDGGWAIRIQG
ncbi:MAG TPA: hypothetical protein VGO52_04995 [Hyphomonadaceae bacterium]|nr:hypothetical protein [Hyphomonadaceae bacterium]